LHKLSIAIIGYGIAGIAAAIHLRRQGHTVQHFEKRNGVQDKGAGMLLQPPALQLLDELGVHQETLDRGTAINKITAQTINNRLLMQINYPQGCFGLGIQRQGLLDVLSNIDKEHRNLLTTCEITEVDSKAGYLFQDQQRNGPYDLIIAADGANSTIRKNFTSMIRRNHQYQWSAIVCCLEDQEKLAGNQLKQFFSYRHHVSTWPVSNSGNNANPCTNIAINIHRTKLRKYLEVENWKTAIRLHCPHLTNLIDRSDISSRLKVYNYRDVELRNTVTDRLVFIGDAAHSLSPQLGQGARFGLSNASLLAKSLKNNNNLSSALVEFEQQQKQKVKRYQHLSRWITPVFQSQNPFRQISREIVFFQ
jgi:2-polyprenyl-6-methoxyphenol hydroxylase-like FAD-dependent oxidoreductase